MDQTGLQEDHVAEEKTSYSEVGMNPLQEQQNQKMSSAHPDPSMSVHLMILI